MLTQCCCCFLFCYFNCLASSNKRHSQCYFFHVLRSRAFFQLQKKLKAKYIGIWFTVSSLHSSINLPLSMIPSTFRNSTTQWKTNDWIDVHLDAGICFVFDREGIIESVRNLLYRWLFQSMNSIHWDGSKILVTQWEETIEKLIDISI